MKVLLVQLPHKDRTPTYFPIGILNIAYALLDLGVECEILDLYALGYSRMDITEFLNIARD